MASSGSETSNRRPRIGLTTYREPGRWGIWECEAVLLPVNYVDTVWKAGGVPVLLPPVPDGAEEAVEGVDAVLVAGGGDVEPERYGAQRHDATAGVSELRDAWEVSVVRAAFALRRPILGVCRGVQVLNVASGGTLHQHVPDVIGHDGHRPAPAVFGTTTVRVDPGSRLHEVLGDEATVRCYHHQALDRLGLGVRAVAWSADDLVEAIELVGPALAIGVQWHPEERPEDLRLLQLLVAEAAESAGLTGARSTGAVR